MTDEIQQLVQPLIAALIEALKLDVRVSTDSGEYLEAILGSADLERCCGLLSEALGPPAKEFKQTARFEKPVQRAIDAMGGIRNEQCLFLKRSASGRAAYAALWPWGSDSARVTLKVGILSI